MPKQSVITSDNDVVRHLRQQPGNYACWLGAGASAEAGVDMADRICNEIYAELKGDTEDAVFQSWAEKNLYWSDPERRYSACLKAYGGPAERVEYFRKKLRGKQPSFCHHAAALLMSSGLLNRSCLTTNFDKLLEMAFAQQGDLECQPIRTDVEADFWRQLPDKCYILKLHGDYDTDNVSNTTEETIQIGESVGGIANRLLQGGGLIVMGTAGNETSVQRFFDDVATIRPGNRALALGLFWGVFVPGPKPDRLSQEELERLLEPRISSQVHKRIGELMDRNINRGFRFFPVWGSGNFLFSCLEATKDSGLIARAERYLDHKMRLRHIFAKAGLDRDAIERHIATLAAAGPGNAPLPSAIQAAPEVVFRATKSPGNIEVRVLYGDMLSLELFASDEFASVRRAVISSEDTSLSAGGGIALAILRLAGSYMILNELAKLSPIGQGEVAVTSGGNLPVHYILHAAALKIESDASYTMSEAAVTKTLEACLRTADELRTQALWMPLMATGVGGLSAEASLRSILSGVVQSAPSRPTVMMIFIAKEGKLPRHQVAAILQDMLARYQILQS